jgi:hypothetical protein
MVNGPSRLEYRAWCRGWRQDVTAHQPAGFECELVVFFDTLIDAIGSDEALLPPCFRLACLGKVELQSAQTIRLTQRNFDRPTNAVTGVDHRSDRFRVIGESRREQICLRWLLGANDVRVR